MSTSCDQKMNDGVCENKSINTSSAIDAVSDGINTNISNINSSICATDSISVCANCEKEGAKNICNKCKQVKYCNAVCKKKHRHKHKKECEEHIRLAAELAAKLYDEKMFKQPPSPHGDCPICFLRMPTLETVNRYYSCCGKDICGGCQYALNKGIKKGSTPLCPFCRTPKPKSTAERIERDKKRVDAGEAYAIYDLGINYRDGRDGYPQDYAKAFELFVRAGEMGFTEAYVSIGYAYLNGRGVEVDNKKSEYYYELAAIGGNEVARYNLGLDEEDAGNMDRAIKHHMIAVRDGYSKSLDAIKQMYSKGYATKEDYTKALQSYQEYLGEIKSKQRDEAAAYDNEEYGYYQNQIEVEVDG